MDHHGKRLVVTSFAMPQPPHGSLVEGIHSQVESADSLYGDDSASPQHSRCFGDSTIRAGSYPLSFTISQPNPGAARTAGDRLSVKTPVGDVRVLSVAFIAHLKDRHRGVGPIVGNGFDYRIPWPTIGAVYERIAVAKIVLIGHLGETIPTGGYISRHLRQSSSLRIAGADGKLILTLDDVGIDCPARFYLS
jgi:hypothetical protein